MVPDFGTIDVHTQVGHGIVSGSCRKLGTKFRTPEFLGQFLILDKLSSSCNRRAPVLLESGKATFTTRRAPASHVAGFDGIDQKPKANQKSIPAQSIGRLESSPSGTNVVSIPT
jgi:hypothetical protein